MTTNRTARRPPKPSPDFPLTPHPSGRWCKKVRGQLCYFGYWRDDPEGKAALEKWLLQKDDLLAGRKPRPPGDGVTVKYVANHFLAAKQQKLDEGALTLRSWQDYRDTCERLVSVFGRNRRVDDLTPTDFQQLRAYLAKGRGPETLSNDVQRSRSVFKYAWDMRLIDRPADFGPDFRRPSKKVRRQARLAKPRKLFTADEITAMLKAASTPMRAMIYLGINAGLGNSDCASLRLAHIDLDRGTLDFPRPKTAIERRATLWPETAEALRTALAERPDPKNPAHADLVFITKYGHPWIQYRSNAKGDGPGEPDRTGSNTNSITLEFSKILRELKIQRERVAFYALRHTLETVGSEAGDQAALDRIMGHERGDMATHYREWVSDAREDERLRKVTDHVRAWLLGKAAKATRSKRHVLKIAKAG